MVHTVLLDAIYRGVNLTTRAVEVGSMNMDAQWLSAYHLGMYTCGVCEPVVSVNQVEFLATGQYARDDAEVIDFVMQIAGITAGKLYAAHIVEALQIIEIGIEMVTETIVVLGLVAYEPILDPVVIDIAPYNRNLTHVDDFQEPLLFARGLRQTEGSLYIALKA